MKIYRNIDEIEFRKDTILTIGTFDGVHTGHKYLLENLVSVGNQNKLRKLIITIHPHPQTVLYKSNQPKIKVLNTIDERLTLLSQFDVDGIFVLEFTPELSEMNAQRFITHLLMKKIGFSKILIGYDHNFGKNREGNINVLNNLSKDYQFETIHFDAFKNEKDLISSSKIRELISNKKIEIANQLLGYNYPITGKCFRGDNRGEKIGFPTANISIEFNNKLIPSNGVYLVKSTIENKEYYGMANVGTRPTVSNSNQIRLEVNYFGINQHLYDKTLTVEFIKYLRDEVKFNNLEELIQQLHKDKKQCLEIISNE